MEKGCVLKEAVCCSSIWVGISFSLKSGSDEYLFTIDDYVLQSDE